MRWSSTVGAASLLRASSRPSSVRVFLSRRAGQFDPQSVKQGAACPPFNIAADRFKPAGEAEYFPFGPVFGGIGTTLGRTRRNLHCAAFVQVAVSCSSCCCAGACVGACAAVESVRSSAVLVEASEAARCALCDCCHSFLLICACVMVCICGLLCIRFGCAVVDVASAI